MKKKKPGKFAPLMSWDISNPMSEIRAKKIEDLETLMGFSELHHWQVDLNKELTAGYQALVLTDSDQQILWVNQGFHTMTGYTPEFALGKKPSFLQGANTSENAKRRIREGLAAGRNITEVVTNYRKDGEEYECRISIIPLIHSTRGITHFLALEREKILAS
ncbi:PAS domain S-box-containing protein [Algoriphagus sp. 4150]|uniref:PAS domain-containing protein n=1 Tax=Algoriphagus sp. 4150 TaxID=2817756 RepID=UPI00285F8289|nr:PAS domain-containing protein [Algoriphagus sp. 4150]MDR7132594.1 PAS domain S-box-containing protein [Algoriphagus sp. 4150]